ncbi:MAG TPA: hypothetical protein VHB93_02225 [Candidatus Paceibacterota bacterium]|nr:hypothetical protein [Candidatus Paceibacterota bacterium]
MADTPTTDPKPQTPAQAVWSGGAPVARLENDQLPANPKRVIRTFASDMQALQSGAAPMPVTQTAPTPAHKPIAPTTPAPKPAPLPSAPATPHGGVSLADAVARINIPDEPRPEPHLPPIQKQGAMYVRKAEAVPPPLPRPAPAPEPIRESIVYEQQPSFFTRLFYSLFGARQTPPQQPIIAPTPSYTPTYVAAPVPAQETGVEPPIGSQIPSAAAAAEAAQREEILSKLRARVSTYQTENVPLPETFPTPPPAAQQIRPRTAPAPLPGVTESVTLSPERLRTFSGDVTNETRAGGESAFSILAAQADAPRTYQQTTVTQTRTSHSFAYVIAATVLVVGGSLVLYFTYNYFAARSPVQILVTAPTGVITGDTSTTISGSGSALLAALAGIADTNLPEGDVELVYLSVGTTTQSGGALLHALQLPAPSILLRNVSENSSVGVVHSGDETRAFFVLDATSYERTFAGMLSWEPTIGQDLATLYPSFPIGEAATTSTSTPAIPAAPHFIDETVQSHDVRALKDGENRTILVYGFRDQKTLIIARDETAFGVLLARLSASH